jgi:GrpB-like predicted nucleotidyltransferase (UPF0157 family)
MRAPVVVVPHEYAALKRALAVRHREDRAAYTDGKSELIASLLADALRLGPAR